MNRVVKISLILLIILITMTGCFGGDKEYASKDKYTKLNIQQMHNDYDSNEITAKEKYPYNYYYFTEKINDVVEYLGDTYLTFMIHSTNKKAKTSGIELTAYFESGDMLKNVKKGDKVTVYCKFKERSIENYFGTTSYSFHSCHFGDKFVD